VFWIVKRNIADEFDKYLSNIRLFLHLASESEEKDQLWPMFQDGLEFSDIAMDVADRIIKIFQEEVTYDY